MSLQTTKTAAEIQQELDKANSDARRLRRELRAAEAAELLSAKAALAEVVAAPVSADTTAAIRALTERLSECDGLSAFLHSVMADDAPQNGAVESPFGDAHASDDGGEHRPIFMPQEGDAEASPDGGYSGYDQS